MNRAQERKRLVLFDIDGTLLTTNGLAKETFTQALHEVYRVPIRAHDYSFAGKTDLQIVHDIMRASGITEAEVNMGIDKLFGIILARLESILTAETVSVYDGVFEILEAITAENSCTLGLLTGNLERGAFLKLAPHGLNKYFRFGAFGSDARLRAALPAIAIERAYHQSGKKFSGKEIVIIGDTEHDITCGAHLHVRTIAVATGGTPYEELQRHHPDYLFEDLRDTQRTLDAILA